MTDAMPATRTLAQFMAHLDDARGDHSALWYDWKLVRDLGPDDRVQAEAELVRLVDQGDALAFETAGILGLQGAIPGLERARDHGNQWDQAAARRALFHLRGEGLETDENGSPVLRGLDAFALRRSPRPEAVQLLIGLLGDESHIARSHAMDGLCEKLGLTGQEQTQGSPLNRLSLLHCQHIATLWQPAAADLTVYMTALAQGASPQSLDLIHVPSRDPTLVPALWQAALERRAFDVEAIRRMGRHDRAWAETLLVCRLRSADSNALTAVVALDVPAWPDHVRAALADLHERKKKWTLDIAAFEQACRDALERHGNRR
jgi:hypothetical protein